MAFTEVQQNLIVDLIKKHLDDQENLFKASIETISSDNKKLRDEVEKLEKRVMLLETDIVECFKDLEVTKRATYMNDQYQRRNNLEISGIPHNIENHELESVCINMINKIITKPGEPYNGENIIIPSDIEACHRLQTVDNQDNKTTIIRFKNRKHCEATFLNKNKIKNLEIEKLGNSVNNIFVNENLCSYYKNLAAKCRRLWKKRKITDTWVSYGLVKIKFKDGLTKTITHQNDLDKLFPNFIYFK